MVLLRALLPLIALLGTLVGNSLSRPELFPCSHTPSHSHSLLHSQSVLHSRSLSRSYSLFQPHSLSRSPSQTNHTARGPVPPCYGFSLSGFLSFSLFSCYSGSRWYSLRLPFPNGPYCQEGPIPPCYRLPTASLERLRRSAVHVYVPQPKHEQRQPDVCGSSQSFVSPRAALAVGLRPADRKLGILPS